MLASGFELSGQSQIEFHFRQLSELLPKHQILARDTYQLAK